MTNTDDKDSLEVVAEKLVFEGKALARVGRYVVFMDGALPGERVRVRIEKRKRKFAVGRVLEILEPSKDRIASDCPLFGDCGGCTFRHCNYTAQLRWKKEVFLESLHGVPGAAELVEDVAGMEQPLYYRNKMVFSFGVDEGLVVIGQHRREDYKHIVPISQCLLQSPESNEILRRTTTFVREKNIPVLDESGQGLLREIMIREGKETGQRLVQLNSTALHPAFEELPALYGALCNTVLIGLDERVQGPPRPTSFRILKGDGTIMERMNGLEFEIGSETFFQTNTLQAERMFQWVLDRVEKLKPALALDLYAGVGPIAMQLSRVAGRVVGVESNAQSVKAAEKNIERNRLANVSMICAEVEKAPAGALPASADVIVVDPPRPGLHKKAVDKIIAMNPACLVYVSCNPATLARDLVFFIQAGFTIKAIRPFDLFPHTFHLESVTVLER
ncbi:MAG: 23S rRNA (uracil(1939)-C(5))-methyltransferase RlmD [Lentisphaerota bacterium]